MTKLFAFTIPLLSIPLLAFSAAPQYDFILQNHRFEPSEVTIPAGQRVKLHIKNMDPTAEEFESFDLHREKIVPANGEITVSVGPLKPGKYEFFGEFHAETAQGVLLVINE
jgi:plastocyanin